MLKKTVALLLILAVTVISAVGCKDKSPDDSSSGDSTASAYAGLNLEEYITLGQYKGLSVDSFDPTVTDEQLNTYIDGILADNATTTHLTDRAAADGDSVLVDFTGKMDTMDTPSGLDATDTVIILGEGRLIDGFEAGIVGMMPGESRDLHLTFPDPYPNNTDLSGQPVTFTVTLKSIEVSEIPELTDDFVKTISDFTTVDEYKSSVMLELYASNQESGVNDQTSALWTQVMESTTMQKYPEEVYQNFITTFTDYYNSYVSYYGFESLEAMLSSVYSMTLDEFNAQAASYAESACLEEMTMNLIAQKEKISVSDDEYNEGAAGFAESYGFNSVDELVQYYGKDAILQSLLWEKILDFLLEQAVVTETAES